MQRKKEEHKPIDQILTTAKVEKILEKERLALPLKRNELLWFKRLPGIRRSGIKFAMTPEEMEEYIKCKLSVYYFAENYFKIKLEDGTIGQMQLRDYQQDIIKLYTENRYSILMASRQIGKCVDYLTVINIKDDLTGKISKVCIGKFYYEEISKNRKLTLLERIKLFLYKILEIVE